MMRLFSIALFMVLNFKGHAYAQYRTALDELFYPETPLKEMVYSPEHKVYLQFAKGSVAEVLLFYLNLSTQTDWQLLFPSDLEAQVWLTGLEKSKKSPVFMLDLYHIKSKVNYNLTIGPNSGTRQSDAQSIITIYSTGRSSIGRQGG